MATTPEAGKGVIALSAAKWFRVITDSGLSRLALISDLFPSITEVSGKIGVGKASPVEKLDVAGNVKAELFISSEYFYRSGTETVLTLPDRSMYELLSKPRQFSATDFRHGTLAYVSNANGGGVVLTEVVPPQGGKGTFSLSGNDVQYNGGSGNPSTTIYMRRLA